MPQDPGFAQVDRCFRTHQPSARTQELMELLLERGRALATTLVETVPPCRERAMALTELEAAVTHARAGLAREDGVAVDRHREQMPRTSAPPAEDEARSHTVIDRMRQAEISRRVWGASASPVASMTITAPQAAALQALYTVLARVVDNAGEHYGISDLSDDELGLLDGFMALHGGGQ